MPPMSAGNTHDSLVFDTVYEQVVAAFPEVETVAVVLLPCLTQGLDLWYIAGWKSPSIVLLLNGSDLR